MTTIRAIQDRVIIEPVFAELTSATGIFLGEGEMTHGRVIAVGPKADSVKVGDEVHFNIEAGHRTQVRRQRVLVIRESEIFGVLEE